MTVISVADAKFQLESLIARAEAGEEIVLARDGRAVAQLLPRSGELPPESREPRVGGPLEGQIWIAPDFDEWPDEIADATRMDLPARVGGQWRGRAWVAPDFDDMPEELAEAFGIPDPR